MIALPEEGLITAVSPTSPVGIRHISVWNPATGILSELYGEAIFTAVLSVGNSFLLTGFQ